MGLREQINEKPALTSGIVGGLVLLLVGYVVWQFAGGGVPRLSDDQSYYSSDDGKTWFAASIEKTIPPFDHNGAMAFRCYVFKCSNSSEFAGYLETYSKEMHDQMTGSAQIGAQHPPADPYNGILVRKPGVKDWVPKMSPQGSKIVDVRCPDGSSEKPQPVMP